MARAQRISDVTLRQSFLERVEINQEIIAEHTRVLEGGQGQRSGEAGEQGRNNSQSEERAFSEANGVFEARGGI